MLQIRDGCPIHMREIVTLTTTRSRSYHCELINELRPDPRVYKVSDHVLAKRSVKHNKSNGLVDKTEFAFTGHWEVTNKLKSASYELSTCPPRRLPRSMSCT